MTNQVLHTDIDGIPVFLYDVTDSTNTRAKEYAKTHDIDRAVFVANGQSAGRGRQGKSFYSPHSTGVYMSYLFRVEGGVTDAVSVTTAASAAVVRAIESLCERRLMIKWVNDIYLDDRKICGILTEAVSVMNRLTHVVIGVGINVTTKQFPDDIRDSAGALAVDTLTRDDIVRAVTRELSAIDLQDKSYLDFYRERMLVLNKYITYLENGVTKDAYAIGIDDDGGLVILTDAGEKTLRSGEITVRLK